jgi:hypothetical protein
LQIKNKKQKKKKKKPAEEEEVRKLLECREDSTDVKESEY